MQNIDAIKRLENEIRTTILSAFEKTHKPIYQHASGRRLFLDEMLKEGLNDGPIVGALAIVYAAGAFMTVDRVERSSLSFKKKRRIIYYLDSRPGQIGSTLLLELLKLDDGDDFSKHKFVHKIDRKYFQTHGINISSGEINESLSRMFRKTMPNFFAVEGKSFVRRPFVIKMQELTAASSPSNISYQNYKNQIDDQTHDLIRELIT